jgi:ABC-type multidrug transport system fused ATPase/permease subunit
MRHAAGRVSGALRPGPCPGLGDQPATVAKAYQRLTDAPRERGSKREEWALSVWRGLTVRYGKRLALGNVSFSVPEGAVYALLGRKGAGKSLLVRCLLGEQRPDFGRVLLLGRDIWGERAAILNEVGGVLRQAEAVAAIIKAE